MNRHRMHYIFSGDVQGVGFRYTACQNARMLGITGWVRNMYDGRVEMEAQGTMPDLTELISQLKSDMYINIDDIECKEIPLVSETSFTRR